MSQTLPQEMINSLPTSFCSARQKLFRHLFVFQHTTNVAKVALYNITADPTEHEDLSETFPEVVKALQERVEYYTKGVVPPLNKPADPEAFVKAYSEGAWTPWQD